MAINMDPFSYDRNELLSKWRDMIATCEPISNWTTGAEIAWLAEMASTRSLVLEVGSYKGKSGKAMAWKSPGVVHCVDRFQDKTQQDFEANLADELKSGKVVLHVGDSIEVAKRLLDSGIKFDLIFIDASHEQADVVRDVVAWEPLLNPGGLLCGHDCYPGDANNGITLALREMGIKYAVVCDSIWCRLP